MIFYTKYIYSYYLYIKIERWCKLLILEKRIYPRDELINIFNTDRLDSIKRSITRQGYKFKNIGRGSCYQMKILELPFDSDYKLKEFCNNELKFNANLDKIKPFLYCIIYFGNDFINLTFKYMKEYIQQFDIDISCQTISNYFYKLINIGLIYCCGKEEYIRYSYDNKRKCRVYISNTYYKNVWNEFFNSNEVIEYQEKLNKLECYNESNKFNILLSDTNAGYILTNKLYNLKFCKKEKKLINGIYSNSINELKNIIPYGIYNNTLSIKEWLIKRGYFVGPFLEGDDMNFYD